MRGNYFTYERSINVAKSQMQFIPVDTPSNFCDTKLVVTSIFSFLLGTIAASVISCFCFILISRKRYGKDHKTPAAPNVNLSTAEYQNVIGQSSPNVPVVLYQNILSAKQSTAEEVSAAQLVTNVSYGARQSCI